MVVSTVNRDSFVVSIDTSSNVDEDTHSKPNQTTLLFNTASVKPTATSTQVNHITPRVTLTPDSAISVNAGVVPVATVPTAATPTSESPSGPAAPASHLTTAALGLGVAVLSTLFLVSICYIYRLVKSRRRVRDISKRPQPPTTPSNWSTSPLSSPNSLEKGGKSPRSTQTRPTTPRKPAESSTEKTNCHAVLEDNKQPIEQCFGSSMTSTKDNVSSASEEDRRGRSHETASIREHRLFRLRGPNHGPRPQGIRREQSQILPSYDNASLPPLPQQGPAEVRELTSILKRPFDAQADVWPAAARGSAKGWLGSVQTRFGMERETYKPTFAEGKSPVGRKGVTFA